MINIRQIIETIASGAEAKDLNLLSRLIHQDYVYKSPRYEIKGKDACLRVISNRDLVTKEEISNIVVEGNQAAVFSIVHISKPYKASIPTGRYMVFEDGLLKEEVLYCDTAGLPDLPESLESSNTLKTI